MTLADLVARWQDTITTNELAMRRQPLKRGHWAPHVVYTLWIRSEGLYKVGMSALYSRRRLDLRRSGRCLVEEIIVPHEYAARLLEATVLVEVSTHHQRSGTLGWLKGSTEIWSDRRPPPSLKATFAAINDTTTLLGWRYPRGITIGDVANPHPAAVPSPAPRFT